MQITLLGNWKDYRSADTTFNVVYHIYSNKAYYHTSVSSYDTSGPTAIIATLTNVMFNVYSGGSVQVLSKYTISTDPLLS